MKGFCPECRRTWSGDSEAHCARCCSHFTSTQAFDRHLAHPSSRDGCYDPATLRDRKGRRVFEAIERVHGPTWRIRRSGTVHHFAGKPPPSLPDHPNNTRVVQGTGTRGPRAERTAA